MIGKLSGVLEYRADDHVLLDVRGVGYIVFCSDRTLASLPAVGTVLALYTDLIVREDLLQLFGFTSLQEKEWHRLLMSVQGVGAKASLAILSTLGPEGVSRAIALGDWNAVKSARGIGPKTAQRVVNELKDKAPKVMAMGGTLGLALGTQNAEPGVGEGVGEDANHVAGADDEAVVEGALSAGGAKGSAKVSAAASTAASRVSAQSDALSALSNLGYAPGEAAGAVAEAAGAAPEAETSVLIRAALKLLAPKG
ncbi:MAG TPA: Holliday junction branch migration protein RuvA [Rhodobacteraceae bacterium]|jgi:Holliday junction DNA helicase RuvA|nr:Holliday junction branch migration protein RuvA [Paracoccaceae bacterium]HBR62744.1 Holliday junction branch migration protein RuvA [Paracoccaceae bacterium]|tara:strand:+ start:7851 stop:8609 length:759 start_codon:yes stop_codon:yes gene_type:complete